MMQYHNNIKWIVIFLILSTIQLIKAEFIPKSCIISLTTELAPNFTFHGQVMFTGPTNNVSTKSILLDASMERIISVEIEAVNLQYTYDKDNGQLTIKIIDGMATNKNYELVIKFSGNLDKIPIGFTKVNVNVDNRGNKWMALTNFKPIYGRKVLPCFEDTITPMVFSLTIIHHENLTAISNMDVYSRTRIESISSDGTNLISTHFHDTLPMPVSQLAFGLVELYDLKERKCNIYHKDQLSYMSTAVKMCDTAINHFETSFNSTLLHKINIIALNHLKNDVVVHMGLSIIHEERLMYRELADDKIRDVAFTLTDVVIRQWIANTKLGQHWRELWIADGITTYLQYEAIDLMKTDWNLMNSFGVMQMHNAFLQDIYPEEIELYKTSKPVEQLYLEGNTEKAASLIRMLVHFVKPKTFKDGLIEYFYSGYRFGPGYDDLNVEFWHEIQKQITFNLKNITIIVLLSDFMNEWSRKTGYPIVTINRQEHNIRIEQNKYRVLNFSSISQEIVWQIPLTYTTSNQLDFVNTIPKYMIKNASQEFSIKLEPNEWIIFNIQQTGYYRVNYDLDNWKLITDTLMDVNNYQHIHQMNRAQLIDDSFHLSSSSSIHDKLQQYEIFLNLTKYLVNENYYVPWQAATNCFDYLIGSFRGTENFDLLRKYMLNQLHHFKNSDIAIGKNFDDGTENALHQTVIYDFKCSLDSKECVEYSIDKVTDLYNGHMHVFNSIPKRIAATIFCTGIRHGNREHWDYFYNLSNDSSRLLPMTHDDNLKVTLSLTCSREPDQLEMLLKNIFKEENADRMNLMCRSLSKTVEGRTSILKFIEDNANQTDNYTDNAYPKCLSFVMRTTYDRLEFNKIQKIATERFATQFEKPTYLLAEIEAAKYMAWRELFYIKTVNWLKLIDKTTQYLLPTDF